MVTLPFFYAGQLRNAPAETELTVPENVKDFILEALESYTPGVDDADEIIRAIYLICVEQKLP